MLLEHACKHASMLFVADDAVRRDVADQPRDFLTVGGLSKRRQQGGGQMLTGQSLVVELAAMVKHQRKQTEICRMFQHGKEKWLLPLLALDTQYFLGIELCVFLTDK